MSAVVSTTAPRLVLIRIAPLFMAARAFASIRCLVSSVRGT